MTQLYLIRHGRTAWNDTGRLQGWADQPLDALGLAQAAALAESLCAVDFDALYSSPLSRARATAEALAAAIYQRAAPGLAVQLDDRLRERNVGEWAGLTLEQARELAPERFLDDWRQAGAPGGETQAALVARVAAALDEFIAVHPQGTVGIVSHGGSLSAAVAHLLGVPGERHVSFSFHNTAVARLLVLPDGAAPYVRLISLGDDRHLDGLTADEAGSM